VTLEQIKHELKSSKREKEEQKWLDEFRAIESIKGADVLDTDELIERDFLVDPTTKRIDGIEDAEVAALIKLSELKKGK
jgi:hypothetical protein